MGRPKDSGTPGKGKHGVPDKQAHKVGKKWEKQQEKKDAKKDKKD